MSKNETIPIYDTALRGSSAIEELRELVRFRHLILQLIRRDIITRYKRSVLGIAWTMLNPLGTTLILAVVFSRVFGSTIGGYTGYVLTGLVAWTFFHQTTSGAIVNLVWGGGLIKRIYIPRTAFAISTIGTGLVNLVLSFIPLVFVMLLFGNPPKPAILVAPIPIIFLAMFALGVGLLVSSIAVFFVDVVDMYLIILTAWMYLSPVIYKEEFIPSEFQWFVRINPMYYLIKLFRAPIYDGVVPGANEFLVAGGIALLTLLIGWLVFTKKSDEFAYRV